MLHHDVLQPELPNHLRIVVLCFSWTFTAFHSHQHGFLFPRTSSKNQLLFSQWFIQVSLKIREWTISIIIIGNEREIFFSNIFQEIFHDCNFVILKTYFVYPSILSISMEGGTQLLNTKFIAAQQRTELHVYLYQN